MKAQEWLDKYFGGEHFQFESRGASMECMDADLSMLIGILRTFDRTKTVSARLEKAGAKVIERWYKLENALFEEVQEEYSDLFQEMYELIAEVEDEISKRVPEGLWFGIEEGGLYGFWPMDDEEGV